MGLGTVTCVVFVQFPSASMLLSVNGSLDKEFSIKIKGKSEPGFIGKI